MPGYRSHAGAGIMRLLDLAGRNRFALLVVALVVFLLLLPVAEAIDIDPTAPAPVLVERIAVVIILAGAAGSIVRTTAGKVVALGLALPSAVLLVVPPHAGLAVDVARAVMGMAFLGYVIAVMLSVIFAAPRVTRETLCAALCIYMLLGVVWALAYTLCAAIETSPFGFADNTATPSSMQIGHG